MIAIRNEPTTSVISNGVQLLASLLACFACLHAGLRSGRYAKSFWMLMASSCAIWAIGQADWMYYDNLLKVPVTIPGPNDLVFFFWMAPMALALSLDRDEEYRRINWERALDSLQVTIVILATYLYFFYMPTEWASRHDWLSARLYVLDFRNSIITLGFFFRVYISKAQLTKSLFRRVGVVLGTYTLGSLLANRALFLLGIHTGNWFDLFYSLPFVLMVLAAATWKEQTEDLPFRKTMAGVTGLLFIYMIPILLPLHALASGGQISRQRVLLAAGAVVASFICYNLRILVANQRQQRAVEQLDAAQSELRQAQKLEAIGTLAGGVAHDFNNLLTIITGYSQILLDRAEVHEETRHAAIEIEKAARRGAGLTKQLLAFSRRQVLQPKVVNLNTVVGNVNTMLKRLVGVDIEIFQIAAPDLGLVKVDPGQIEQVVMNLVVNARDAMPRGGKLTIATSNKVVEEMPASGEFRVPSGNYVMLSITDTGVGMDEATKARIFEPFFTTKEVGKGTGLGLSTVYGIVNQSRGSVQVTSEVGLGTTFNIYFPRVFENETSLASGKKAVQSFRGSETILLVEDEEELRKLSSRILSANGYNVLEADRSAEAERICADYAATIDMVLTDVVIPGLKGPELVKRLLTLRPGLKVVYMSGYVRNSGAEQIAMAPGSIMLQKPFTPDELTQKVRTALNAVRLVIS